MKRCKHENTDHIGPGPHFEHWNRFELLGCLDCNTWLSLGPAPEPAPGSLDWIQKRAAEIADAGKSGQGIDTWGEHDGWHADSRKPPASARPFRSRPRQLAGWLARIIATHRDEP